MYVADALQLAPQSKYPKSRFYDLIRPRGETVDAEQVIADVIAKAGLVIRDEPT